MTDEFDPAALNAHQKALLAQTNDFQKAWFEKELNPAEKAEVMALHTGMSPEGDRPLLRRPEPEYVSSREMLDVLWRRSPYAPVDKAFDHGIDYAFEIDDPEIDEFERWISAVFALGLLPASVKGDDNKYRTARVDSPTPDDLVGALRKNMPITVHVRTDGISDKGIEPAFPNLTSEEATDSPLRFNRADVGNLSCHADDMREVVRRSENDSPLADLDRELVAHINERRADALVKMGATVSTDLASETAPLADAPNLMPTVTGGLTVSDKSKNSNVGREPKYVWFINELWRTCVCPENHPVPVTDRELLKITRKRLKNDHRPLPVDAPVYARSVMDAFKGLPS